VTAQASFDSAQRFILAAKGYWTTALYTDLREQYVKRCAEQGVQPATVAQVAAVAEELTVYQYFAWLERHLQIAKYSGRYGLAHYYREHADDALKELTAQAGELPNLELDPALRMPSYYVATDIHQHPGGVWSEPTAGVVYQHGARSTTPLLGASHGDLHTRFTDRILAGGEPARVLDLACGFGKSTMPFAAHLPKASIRGIDLAEPCLRLAARNAITAGLENVRFAQRDASHAGFADGSFDLVTSTMFLHEIPLKVLDQVLDESFRLLEPGGRMVHLDFWHMPDPFSRFLHYGHGRRNNEPYMQPLAELDLPKVLERKGFVDILIEPFSETLDTDLAAIKAWRFPWTYISARKPA
jgi:SAM-dependent methyltransferase